MSNHFLAEKGTGTNQQQCYRFAIIFMDVGEQANSKIPAIVWESDPGGIAGLNG